MNPPPVAHAVEGHFLWDLAGSGFWILLVISGLLALILPGRFDPIAAGRVGLGRHVEALLVVSLIITFAIGTSTHVPVFIGPGGVVAVSLLGAIVPTILAIYFLVAAGWRRLLLSLIPIAAVSLASFYTSQPVPDLGIIARPPYYFLPAMVAAGSAVLVAWRSLHAIPLAYTYGALGALVGADLLRIEWIVATPFTAASIGGADAFDLVFLMGLWSAAFAAILHAPRILRMRHHDPRWLQVARLAEAGAHDEALDEAHRIVRRRLGQWADERGFRDVDDATLLHASHAAPVFRRMHGLHTVPRPWDAKELRQVLEDLAGLERRLQQPFLEDVATRKDRFLAGLIDLAPVLLVAVFATITAFRIPLEPIPNEPAADFLGRRFTAGIILVLWSTIGTHVLYPFFAEWATGGRTIGKAIIGLEVRSRDGSRPDGWALFVRNLTRLVDMLLLYLLPFVGPMETGRERLGDHYAETYVAKRDHGAKIAPSIPAETMNERIMPTRATQWSLETTRPPR